MSPAPWATPMATGAMAAMVPMLVPMAVEMKQHIRNTPGIRKEGGTNWRQKFTTEVFPPMAAAAPWNPPARR